MDTSALIALEIEFSQDAWYWESVEAIALVGEVRAAIIRSEILCDLLKVKRLLGTA